jgi:hypothetical protein
MTPGWPPIPLRAIFVRFVVEALFADDGRIRRQVGHQRTEPLLPCLLDVGERRRLEEVIRTTEGNLSHGAFVVQKLRKAGERQLVTVGIEKSPQYCGLINPSSIVRSGSVMFTRASPTQTFSVPKNRSGFT